MLYSDLVWPEMRMVMLGIFDPDADRSTPTCSAWGERGTGAPAIMMGVASQSLKHGLAVALKYILEWAAAVCTAIPHVSVQFVQSLADTIEYNWEWQHLFVL